MARAALVALCASCLVAVAHAGAGANEPIDPNELGLTSTDCAQQYCSSKDALMLWFSLENICLSDMQPYVLDLAARGASDETSVDVWSPATVGTISALFGVVGLMVGYSAGGRYQRQANELGVHRYEPVA